ncbi:unnamed protein product [Arabis nemorensis]|uniref:Uncharacterized protein n=1 Tax=Arabis nemorensis TaxID=586526 RepID=A0A565CEU5_9BRAS|nr:unnamed protein product [Arabis nemorensis]
MMMKNPNKYSKIEKEYPNEMVHRRAQFLIHKILQRADTESLRQQQKRTTTIKMSSFKVVGIKMKIGKKLRKLRKSCVMANKHGDDLLLRVVKSLKRYFFCSSSQNVSDVPPRFTLHV